MVSCRGNQTIKDIIAFNMGDVEQVDLLITMNQIVEDSLEGLLGRSSINHSMLTRQI